MWVYGFQLLLTLSDIPPIRAHAVIVVVVIVVDVAGRRNAKKVQRATYIFLFVFSRSPCNRHIFDVGNHFAPIFRRSAAKNRKIHR